MPTSANRPPCSIQNLGNGYEALPTGGSAGIRDDSKRVAPPDGDDLWFSVWGGQKDEFVMVMADNKKPTQARVIKDQRLITPTGKFNVYNTQHDVY